jgi:hypothetical protein
MPTERPRLSLTLSDNLAWQLRRLSELTGTSQSALITSMLEGSDRFLWRLITTLEAAEEAKQRIPRHVSNLMAEAQGVIESKFGLVESLDRVQEGTGNLRSLTGAKRGPASRGNGRPSETPNPLSNRGGRSKPKQDKKSMESRG